MQDSLIVITPQQLKQTNLIFLEHSKLKSDVYLLNGKIKLESEINSKLKEAIKIKDITIDNYKLIDNINRDIIAKKEKTLQKYKAWTIGGIAITTAGILLLIVK